jgi:hypothetical protein
MLSLDLKHLRCSITFSLRISFIFFFVRGVKGEEYKHRGILGLSLRNLPTAEMNEANDLKLCLVVIIGCQKQGGGGYNNDIVNSLVLVDQTNVSSNLATTLPAQLLSAQEYKS